MIGENMELTFTTIVLILLKRKTV